MPSSADNDPHEQVREARFEYTPRFPGILAHLRASILVTTYQAGHLLVIGAADGKLQISFLSYDQPMGLAVSRERIAIGSRKQMHFLVPAHETLSGKNQHDGCFVPRSSVYTGNIHGHDLGWGSEGLWIVNTLFSCLSTLHEGFSFVPQWRPPFISRLIDQDRCHLNGMALAAGAPKYVTALGETDSAAGWRPDKATGGIVMEVTSGQVVCRGLSMPHSPRLHRDRLWVLNSGRGSLGWVNPSGGNYEEVESMPGYTRGLSFCGQFAFVGLSKIRETSVFGGVPIAERRDELRCGVGVVDLTTGKTVAVLQFFSAISEIFAVEILQGFVNPLFAGASVDRQEREVWIVPAEDAPRPYVTQRVPIFSGSKAECATTTSKIDESTVKELASCAVQLKALGKLDQASALLERAAVLSSAPARLLVDLGNLRQDQGCQAMALTCYQRAVEADPTCLAALQNLGYLQFNMGEAEKASDVYARLIGLDPSAINHLLAASVLPVVYDSRNDIDYWRQRQIGILRALVGSGATVDATKTLVPTCFFAAYQGVNDRVPMELRGRSIQGRDFTGNRPIASSAQRLRVGFMSAYFKDHTIGRLNIVRLEKLSRRRIELTIIDAGQAADCLARRFAATADRFVRLPRELSSAIVCLTGLELDILVHADVGMDSLTQTLAFSRFAPIQVATWGHPDTSGSAMIDYFLSSESLETEESHAHYTERLVKLPSLGIDYERPILEQAKSRSELGLDTNRRLYCCPQTLFKLHPEFDQILDSILRTDPQGELILLQGRLPEWTHRLQRRFRRTLSDANRRVRYLPALPRNDFLSLLANVDVLLDPIHFGGGNSSLESIAMGTPLVTMEGPFLRSRITSALYAELSIPDLIARNFDEYSRMAVRIANDPTYRNELRQRILENSTHWFARSDAAEQLEHCLLGFAGSHL